MNPTHLGEPLVVLLLALKLQPQGFERVFATIHFVSALPYYPLSLGKATFALLAPPRRCRLSVSEIQLDGVELFFSGNEPLLGRGDAQLAELQRAFRRLELLGLVRDLTSNAGDM